MRRVQATIWQRHEDLPLEAASDVTEAPVQAQDATGLSFKEIQLPTAFGPAFGGWAQRWFRLDVPAAVKGEEGRRHLSWKAQGETTAYLLKESDLVPWCGLDNVHPTCPLPDEAATIYLACGCWQTGIWGPNRPLTHEGIRIDGVSLSIRDEKAWQAYCDLDVLHNYLALLRSREGVKGTDRPGFGYIETLPNVSPLLRKALRLIERCCDAQATGDIDTLLAATRKAYEELKGAAGTGVAALFGHAHIDVVWLWPEWVADEKAIHSFATVCRLLERYPEVRFTQSMPSIYRRLTEISQDSLRQIEEARSRGQWEVTGAFEVEPDVNLPCGEALARSVEVGQRQASEVNGGELTSTCWLPDVFGYSQCLPQILKLSGVDRFFTTKMHWSAITRFPYSSFVWQGPDGKSEVLSHISPIPYNGRCDINEHEQGVRRHRQADLHEEVLLGTGFGDGGGAMTEQMCERARRQTDLMGAPVTRWTSAGDFFDRLNEQRQELPKYRGELYLEYHRGTYTTQSEHKRLYRRAEVGLQVHEAALVATGTGPLAPADHDDRWRRVLFAQFHDALPGSSIKVVYDELNPELEAVGDRELADAAACLGAGKSHVFNPLATARDVYVEGTGVVSLGALESKPLEAKASQNVVEASETSLSNGIVRATFEGGRLSSMIVDGFDLELSDACGLRLYHDDPVNYDAWDIDHYTAATGVAVSAGSLTVTSADEHRAVLETSPVELPDGAGSVVLRYILDADSRHLRIETDVDWQAEHRLLKYHVVSRQCRPVRAIRVSVRGDQSVAGSGR